MHPIYHTPAFVLKRIPVGEANLRVWLYTRELGLVVATVQGVRKPGAKLVMQVREYARISANLIKGRSVWRLVSATFLGDPIEGKLRDPRARAYVRTLEFLLRFVTEEEVSTELFAHLCDVASALELSELDPATLDALSLWKMLALLGYIAPREQEEILLSQSFGEALLQVTEQLRPILVAEATTAIKESHL